MIFYFTATGNSLEAARTIADITHDDLQDIGAAMKAGTCSFPIEQGTNLGFVVPVYAWTTPLIIDTFLQRLTFITHNGNRFVPGYSFIVFTCGMCVGHAAKFFEKQLFEHQHIRLDASYSIQTVDNCIFLMGPGSEKTQHKKQQEAHRQARVIGHAVDSKRMAHQEKCTLIGSGLSFFTSHSKKQADTKPFSVDTTLCTHCGMCETLCPTNTIHIEEGVPVWAGEGCTWCSSCIQRCPVQAIQYGTGTKKRARYTHPILASNPIYHSETFDRIDMDIPDPEPVDDKWTESTTS